jgi:hypothetical protein
MDPLEQALRWLIADLDYDIHKSIERDEWDGEDKYPALAGEFRVLLEEAKGGDLANVASS